MAFSPFPYENWWLKSLGISTKERPRPSPSCMWWHSAAKTWVTCLGRTFADGLDELLWSCKSSWKSTSRTPKISQKVDFQLLTGGLDGIFLPGLESFSISRFWKMIDWNPRDLGPFNARNGFMHPNKTTYGKSLMNCSVVSTPTGAGLCPSTTVYLFTRCLLAQPKVLECFSPRALARTNGSTVGENIPGHVPKRETKQIWIFCSHVGM